jgi:outer membrane lipoprotein-sorting protein
MKHRLHFFPAILMIAMNAGAQSVDDIIRSHIDAMGGAERMASLRSLYTESISVMANGNEVSSKVWRVQDKLVRREIDFGMGNMKMVVTDKEGWSTNPRSGGAFEAMPPERAEGMRAELDLAGPLFQYASKGHRAELLGKEDVNGKSCHVVKLTLKTGRDITYYFDPGTYYILRTKTKGGGMMRGGGGGAGGGGQRNPDQEVLTDYSDYRKTPEGYVFAYTVTVVGMGAAMNMEKIEVNPKVDEKLFKAE